MGKALFLGGSAAFMTAYILFAEAFGLLGTDDIAAIGAPGTPEGGSGFFAVLDAILSVFIYVFELIGRFFQLLTFQFPGTEVVALISLFIFIPLTFINGFILFTAIRGS